MTFQWIFEWLSGEVKWLFFIAFLIGVVFFAFKRAWIAFGSFVIGMIFIAMFIASPENMISLGEWLASKMNLGG
ncbi:hypothetical protein [Bacillus sp. FJAT-47783]|uniref:hypothetical protein n=1 Tax=Bacillus sp. FJAT-47783 TaxID=2922712 RepID=UPI001FAB8DE5|nr:hypothetical protein [Bacillus sp. FJAT-47783]